MTTIHVRELGAGPAVLLLHGTPTTPEHLEPLARALSSSYRVLLAHSPGYGETPAIEPYALDVVHEALEAAVLRARAADVAIVGFSGGAHHAFALACRAQLRVRGVASLAGSANMGDARQRLVQTAAALRANVDLSETVPGLFLSPAAAAIADARAEVMTWIKATSWGTLANELEALANAPDLLPALEKLDLPILLRVGALDLAAPPNESQRVATACKRATLQVVPDVGHALLTEDFAGTLAATREALSKMGKS